MPTETSVKAKLNPDGAFTDAFSSAYDTVRSRVKASKASLQVDSSVTATLLP